MAGSSKRAWGSSGFLLRPHEWALLASILAVVAATAALDKNHAYLHSPVRCLNDNFRNIAPIGMLALGAAVVIIAGGIDLSAGSAAAFAATIAVAIMVALRPAQFGNAEVMPWWVTAAGCTGAVLTGLMIGTVHTWLIVALRLPPFIVTLGSLVGLRSFARAICHSVTDTYRQTASEEMSFNDPFIEYLDSHVWISVAVLAVLSVLIWLIMTRTVLGRHVYALGGNEQAAVLSGIRTNNVKWFAYCFSAVCASIAGVFYIAKQHGLAPTTMAGGHELNAIAAAVVGGCSLQGGLGTIQGTILGAIFLQAVVDAVARIVKTNANMYEGMIVGIVVVLAVTISQLRQIVQSGRQLFAGWLGWCVIPILALVIGALALMTGGKSAGMAIGLGALGLLVGVKVIELTRARRFT
jgi:ribose/xylose/arabinose/galactoside ABC-type transport system permease subunit